MGTDFKFIMIGAMYENGGNTAQRFLDGHPELYVYPFESQLGTQLVSDYLSSVFPVKYRWPVFPSEGTACADYKAIIDEEAKVRARTPSVSKFRTVDIDMDDDKRCNRFQEYIQKLGRSRPNNIEAFFRATFDTWKNYRKTGREAWYVGYSPICVVDANIILEEIPQSYFIHVVRNPWSAYADTKKRPVPLPLEKYMFCWSVNQYYAAVFKDLYPDRFFIVRFEDLVEDSYETLGAICDSIGIERADSLRDVSWNGTTLDEIYPWGTIRKATKSNNYATAMELKCKERDGVLLRGMPYIEMNGYQTFLK